MIRESLIMRIHYITGISALFVVAVHIIMRLLMPFDSSIEYQNIIANYHNIAYSILLESILVLLAIHGFNGLRIMLLELRQNRLWENGVTIFTISAMMTVVAYGTRTIIVAQGLGA